MKTVNKLLGIAAVLAVMVFSFASCSDNVDNEPVKIAQKPVITVHPDGDAVERNGTYTLSVTAVSPDGGALSYQWYLCTNGPTNVGGMRVNGATSDTYSPPTGTVEILEYFVEVTNTVSKSKASERSEVAIVTVTLPGAKNAQKPAISTQPANGTVVQGTEHSLSVTADPPANGILTYQWYRNTSASTIGGTAAVGRGAESAVFSPFTGTAGTYYYFVEVTNTITEGPGDGGVKTASVKSSVSVLTVTPDPSNADPTGLFAEVFDKIHVEVPLFGRVLAVGAEGLPVRVPVRGSVIHHMFENFRVTDDILPVSSRANQEMVGVVVQDVSDYNKVAGHNTTRSGALKPGIEKIIYHDTANTGLTSQGNTTAHSLYLKSDPGSASWHYTVDGERVIQHIPDNEIAWHGGNRYANMYSIGIETCVNYGQIKNDFFLTWQRMARLVAGLLDKYDLTIDDVWSHKEVGDYGFNHIPQLNDWIKCCPVTLRHANLYEMARGMIQCELWYLQKVEQAGYTAAIIIDPAFSEFIDGKGRVIQLPAEDTEVSYTVKLTAPDSTIHEKRYTSVLYANSHDYFQEEGDYFITRCDLPGCSYNSIKSIP